MTLERPLWVGARLQWVERKVETVTVDMVDSFVGNFSYKGEVVVLG